MLPSQFAFRTVALVAAFAFLAGVLAAVANAQEAVPARTIAANGAGLAKVTPRDRDSNASIVAAVTAAEAKALPLAFADAQAQAKSLAQVAGVTLGALQSISNDPPGVGYFGGFGVTQGTFGPDQYCGDVRTRSVTVGKDGKRHYGKYRTRRTCRFPSTLQRTVRLTYAIA